MITTQSAIYLYFTFSWRCHYLHRFRTNLSFSFGDLIKICNRNVTFKTKSHLIRYGRLTIKKQGLLWNIWKRCPRIFPENFPCSCSIMSGISALWLIKNVTSWTSLVVQCLRILSANTGTRVWSLIWEDSTSLGAAKPTRRSCWSPRSRACALQQEKRESESCSVVSDFLRPHGLYSPWNSLGQNTGVGSLSLLQGLFPTQGSNPGLPHCRQSLLPFEPPGKCEASMQKLIHHKALVLLNHTIRKPFHTDQHLLCAGCAQLCPTLCNPMNCSPSASSVHGILQARMLEWVAISSSRQSSWPRDRIPISYASLHRQVDSLPLGHLGSLTPLMTPI